MTVSAGYTPSTYTADGNIRNWAIAFEYSLADEVHIRLVDDAGEITEITTNYTVDTDNDRVIYPTVASGLPLVETGITVVVYRSYDNEQVFDATVNPFSASGLNDALDAIVKRSQELTSEVGSVTTINNEIINIQADLSTIESNIAANTGDIVDLQEYDQSNTATIQYILQNLGGGGGGGGGGAMGSAYDLLNDCGCLPESDCTPVLTAWFAVNTQDLAIYVPPLTFIFDTSFEFPENCKALIFDPAGNAILSPEDGATLTFTNQWIEAQIPNQILGLDGDLAGTWRNDRVLPEWFGAVTCEYNWDKNGYIDSTIAMQRCFTFAGQSFGWYPVVWLNPVYPKRTYYVTDSLITESQTNIGLRIDSASIANAKNSEGRNNAVIELDTTDDTKYLFHIIRTNWNYENAIMIRNVSFRASSGGGVLNIPSGIASRILIENVNTYGIHGDTFTDWIDNELVQVLPTQCMWRLVEPNGLIVKGYANEGGWLCWHLIDADDCSMTDIRISAPFILKRTTESVLWLNEQQLNIRNLETEQSLFYISNGCGKINVDGWHQERNNTGAGNGHYYNLTEDFNITCESTKNSNVLTFSEDMTNKLHADLSIISIENPDESLYRIWALVKEVDTTLVTIYANEYENDDTYALDVNWTHATNIVHRYHSYVYLSYPQAPSSPSSLSLTNFYGGYSQHLLAENEYLMYLYATWYGLNNMFINCKFHEAQFGDNGVKIIGNRIGDNNSSGMSNTNPGCTFIGCNEYFLPKNTNHPFVNVIGQDLSLGNNPFPNGRGKNKSTVFEKKVIDRAYFFGLRDCFNRIGWAATHRYNIFQVGESGTDQSYMAAWGNQIHLEDFKFPNHACYLRFRLLAFTAVGDGDLELKVSASGAGEFMRITITEERAPIEFITQMPASLVGRTVEAECMFFISHDTDSFYFVACEITEELNPYIAGSGLPQGEVYAPPGTMYLNRDGGAGVSAFVKESGTGNTGWAVIGKPAWYDLEKDAGCISGQSIISALNSFFTVHQDEDLCLYIGKGTWIIDDDYTFNVYARTIWFDFAGGAVIQVAENCLFRWNRQTLIASPQNQLFTGDGYVGGQLFNDTIYPEWFGVKSQYYASDKGTYTDYTDEMKKCMFFTNDGNWQPTIRFNGNGDKGVYYFPETLASPGFVPSWDGTQIISTLVLVGDWAETDFPSSKSILRYTGYYDSHWAWTFTTNSTDDLEVVVAANSTINVKLANSTASKNRADLIQAAIRALGQYEADGDHTYQNFENWTVEGNLYWDLAAPIAATGETGDALSGKGLYTVFPGLDYSLNFESYAPYFDYQWRPNFNFKIEGRAIPGGVDANSESVIIESGIANTVDALFDLNRESYAYVSPISIKNLCFTAPQGGAVLRVNSFHERCQIENVDVIGLPIATYANLLANDEEITDPDKQTLIDLARVHGLEIKNLQVKGGWIGLSLKDCTDAQIDNLFLKRSVIGLQLDTDGVVGNDNGDKEQINIKTLSTIDCVAGVIQKYGRVNIDGWRYERGSTVGSLVYTLSSEEPERSFTVTKDSNLIEGVNYSGNSLIPDLSVVSIYQSDLTYDYFMVKSSDDDEFEVYANDGATDDTYSQSLNETLALATIDRYNSYAFAQVPKIPGQSDPRATVRNFYGEMANGVADERFMYLYGSPYTSQNFTNCTKQEKYNTRAGVFIFGNRVLSGNSSMDSNTGLGISFIGCNAEFLPTIINHPLITVIGPDLTLGNPLFPGGRSKNFSTVMERKILDRSFFFGLKDIFNRLGWIGSHRYPISAHGESGTDQQFYAAYGEAMHMEDFKFPNHACYLRIKILAFTVPTSGTLTLSVDAYGTASSLAFTSITIGEDSTPREIIVANPAVMIGRTMSDDSLFAIRHATTAFYFAACEIKEDNNLVLAGTGSPENVQIAPVGCLYLRKDGGANTTLYIKETGSGNTGWIAK